MDSAALRELVRDYQFGLRDDIEVLESYFNHVWCFIDGDGYEFTLLYGKGIYAILYHHRKSRQVAIDFLSESNPLRDLTLFVGGLEGRFGISVEDFLPRILAEFAQVEGRDN
ncbi:hypothetical protein [Aquiflexum lacus]|uniref:hypothetical protein n=1 Tax=Aquiflexum lacus TaxID=2483805 RepID=UPI00189626B6|nr:hypothetical protein [Aquiflexum lacus]